MTGAAFQNRAVSPKSPRTPGARISSALKELHSNSQAARNEQPSTSRRGCPRPCTKSDGRPLQRSRAAATPGRRPCRRSSDCTQCETRSSRHEAPAGDVTGERGQILNRKPLPPNAQRRAMAGVWRRQTVMSRSDPFNARGPLPLRAGGHAAAHPIASSARRGHRGMKLLQETLPACSATVRSPMMWPRQTWRRS